MTNALEVESDVGTQLRTWRERRRLSQLELAHRSEVSTRHLSFVETGRSRPTPEMILRLAESLDVPIGERNRLLLAGGFAPRFGENHLADDSLEPVMTGLRHLLDAHLPYPALLLDEGWDIVDANDAVQFFLEGCDPALLEPPLNALRLTFHPGGLAPRIRNLDAWAGHLLGQIRHRRDRIHDPRLSQLLDEIASYVGSVHTAPTGGPVLSLELETGHPGEPPLLFFSVAARIETATDVTLAGLHLETFLPADAATAVVLSQSSTVRAT